MAALIAVAVITALGAGMNLNSNIAAYAEHDISKDKTHGKAWPKTTMYLPENAEGLTGLTIAQCDSPAQCKDVNGTPSSNLAAKKACEEFSGEKCKKFRGELE